jgi:hypothetical protein
MQGSILGAPPPQTGTGGERAPLKLCDISLSIIEKRLKVDV